MSAFPLRYALPMLVLLYVALELSVSHWVKQPPQLMVQVEKYQHRAPGPHLVVFGTCLGDAMMPEVVEAAWGTSTKVHNLAFRGSTALEWSLILSRYLDVSSDLHAVTVVVGANDLHLHPSPWESQVVDLATWSDIPDLIQSGCSDVGCGLEMGMRKLSVTWRIRPYIALQIWKQLGTEMPGIPSMPIRGQDAMINAERMSLEPSAPPPDIQADGAKQDSSWHQNTAWIDQKKDASFWLRKLIADTEARGVPLILIPLPRNPGLGPTDLGPLEALAKEHQTEILSLGSETPMSAEDYLDDVHFTQSGLQKIATAIGHALQRRFPEG